MSYELPTQMSDTEALNRIALVLRVVNEKDTVLSPLGIELLSRIVENTGRNSRGE